MQNRNIGKKIVSFKISEDGTFDDSLIQSTITPPSVMDSYTNRRSKRGGYDSGNVYQASKSRHDDRVFRDEESSDGDSLSDYFDPYDNYEEGKNNNNNNAVMSSSAATPLSNLDGLEEIIDALDDDPPGNKRRFSIKQDDLPEYPSIAASTSNFSTMKSSTTLLNSVNTVEAFDLEDLHDDQSFLGESPDNSEMVLEPSHKTKSFVKRLTNEYSNNKPRDNSTSMREIESELSFLGRLGRSFRFMSKKNVDDNLDSNLEGGGGEPKNNSRRRFMFGRGRREGSKGEDIEDQDQDDEDDEGGFNDDMMEDDDNNDLDPASSEKGGGRRKQGWFGRPKKVVHKIEYDFPDHNHPTLPPRQQEQNVSFDDHDANQSLDEEQPSKRCFCFPAKSSTPPVSSAQDYGDSDEFNKNPYEDNHKPPRKKTSLYIILFVIIIILIAAIIVVPLTLFRGRNASETAIEESNPPPAPVSPISPETAPASSAPISTPAETPVDNDSGANAEADSPTLSPIDQTGDEIPSSPGTDTGSGSISPAPTTTPNESGNNQDMTTSPSTAGNAIEQSTPAPDQEEIDVNTSAPVQESLPIVETTLSPTAIITQAPVISATSQPTKIRTSTPTKTPTRIPTKTPTRIPTKTPTRIPTTAPIAIPISIPTTPSPTKEEVTQEAPVAAAPSPDLTPPSSSIITIQDFTSELLQNLTTSDSSTAQARAAEWVVQNQLSQIEPSIAFLQPFSLATFYYSTNGANWTYCGQSTQDENTCIIDGNQYYRWLSSENECQWYGVSCTDDGTVSSIVLDSNELGGSLPSELVLLSNLEELSARYNEIGGTLPTLEFMPQLRSLFLNNNNINGTLPISLGSTLDMLSLGNNELSGTIPGEFFTNSNTLTKVSMRGNSFNGSIPEDIYTITTLDYVDLGSNQLTGSISESWSNLRSLEVLTLSNNFLTGTLPFSVFTPSLVEFSAGMNFLDGTIPDGIYSEATNLQYLNIGANSFSSTIPTGLSELTSLQQLILWENGFTGSIPSSIGNIKGLEMFEMPYNNIVGTMPEEICNLRERNLEILSSDCKSLLEDDVPKVDCSCCTTCYSGY